MCVYVLRECLHACVRVLCACVRVCVCAASVRLANLTKERKWFYQQIISHFQIRLMEAEIELSLSSWPWYCST